MRCFSRATFDIQRQAFLILIRLLLEETHPLQREHEAESKTKICIKNIAKIEYEEHLRHDL